MILRTIAASLLILLTAGPAVTSAQSNDQEEGLGTPWPVTRLPLTPHILEGGANPVCQALVEAARSAFVSSGFFIDLYTSLPPTADIVKWDDLEPPFAMRSEDELSTAAVDLDGDGRVESLLKRSDTWSWRGPNYSAFVFRDVEAMRSALASATNVDEFLKQGVDYVGGTWAWNDLFEFDGSYYFVGQGNYFALYAASQVDGYRLEASGATTPVCRLEVMPAGTPALTRYPGLAAFIEILRSIGHAGPSSGTLRSETVHDESIRGAVLRAGIRPWAMGAGRETLERTEEFIRDWSLRDPWSRREYLTYIEHRESALPLLTEYLAETFGMTQQAAATYAEQVFRQLVASHFLVPSSFPSFPRDNGSVVIRLLAGTHTAADTNVTGVVELSIDNPRALRAMLERGANPNTANDFGKTLLMYAAHLNRPDAVAELLAAGANVNAQTHLPAHTLTFGPTGFVDVQRGSRTALMYAAENASIEVMAAIVDAGARIDAIDSRGEGIDDYLARNPRYRSAGDFESLLADYRSNPPAGGPSINCARASSRVEQALCDDPVAALYDRELGSAYATWQAGASDARADQRGWLRRRNAQCEHLNDDYEVLLCVQQATRARTRYIENRIDEP